jgi:hypothetical protein
LNGVHERVINERERRSQDEGSDAEAPCHDLPRAAEDVADQAGIRFMPRDIWIEAYSPWDVPRLIQSCITAAEAVRDVREASKLREPHRGRQDRAAPDGSRQNHVGGSSCPAR